MKKFFSTLLTVLGVLFCCGVPLLFFLFFGLFGMFPVYVTKAGAVFGTVLTLVLALLASGCLSPRVKRILKYGTLAVGVGCLAFMGIGAYQDSVPTVDDRDLLLGQYEPFDEGNRLATLEEPSTLQLNKLLPPKLDGATALYPVYAAFAQAVYPEGEYRRYSGPVDCTGTIDAYERLIHREVDMIFAAAPSQDQLDLAAKKGMQLYLTPIGREAFVFFVNSQNPVTDLTVEQVQGIYSGEITNWKEVGGKFQRIRPYQRAENSGSQSALLRLMEGLPLMEPEKEDRITGMDGIIRRVADYRNFKNAIGFSFRYYSTEMVQNGDIRLLALNGVEPTRETIRDGSYPISSEFYAVTAAPIGLPAPQETNEDLSALLEWILSPQGQALIEKTGYVALS